MLIGVFGGREKKFFNVGLNVFLLLSLDEKRFQQQNEDSSVLLFAENNYDFMALLWRAWALDALLRPERNQ